MTNETQGSQVPASPGDGAGPGRSHRTDPTDLSGPGTAPSPARAADAASPGTAPSPARAAAPSTAATPGPGAAAKVRLFGLSFLMLFVELALIRWTGANILYLSYFSNFVLLGSFLGIGLGFLRARSRVNLFPWASVALALLVLFVLVFPVQVNRTGSRLLFFTSTPLKTTGLPTWVTLPVIFLAVAAVMMMLGEGVARTFVRFRPLEAYRLDILGSIAGIAVFSALSFINAKPIFWGLIVAVALAALQGRRIGLVQVVGLVALVGLLGWETVSSADLWSPYYRISVVKHTQNYVVSANGVPHQVIEPQRDRSRFYFLPYRQAVGNPLSNVLIIGAGTGNDVATALAEGAKHVDAVEIDPQIYALGRRLNPNHPYQNPRVSAHVNDGRAFLQQTKAKYNMILFALPDSLTLVAGQSQLRLESYLFTLQAIQAARAHLNPSNGVFAMYNYYRTTWLRDRLANTLDVVFGHPPCAHTTYRDLSMLTVSVNPAAVHCGSVWQRPRSVVAPATDDHPFVYLESPSIPGYYLLTLLMILLASVIAVRAVSGPIRRVTGYVDLFFMGAAFLLLETKSVVQFALLFGTTWFVNALVFAGVLVAVYAAVEASRRVVVRRPAPLYLALLATLIVAWAVPDARLLSLPVVPRFAAAVALAFAPIFLANVVFAQRFRDTADSTLAFGSNLLGAMVGGLLEYTSLIIGYRWLLAIVAVLYGLAFVIGLGGTRSRPVIPYAGTGSRRVGQTTP
jgi:spermidine synthase